MRELQLEHRNLNYRQATDDDIPLLASLNAQLLIDEGHRQHYTREALESRFAKWLLGYYRAVLFDATLFDATLFDATLFDATLHQTTTEPVLAYALYRISPRSPEKVFLRHFWVSKPYRRHGVGRKVFETLRNDVFPEGAKITLEALARNKRARSFWTSLGFVEYSVTLELA